MPKFQAQKGFSLIEILIAVLVISIGLLGVASMQLLGLKGNHQSFSKNQAAHHAQSLLERIRGNPSGVTANQYLFNSSTYDCGTEPANDCGVPTASCSSDEMAVYDLFKAYCGNKNGTVGGMKGDLSNARLNITCPVNCTTGISLSLGWDEQLLGTEGENAGDASVARNLMINTVISR